MRNGYHMLAAQDPQRMKLIEVTGGIDETHGRIIQVLKEFGDF